MPVRLPQVQAALAEPIYMVDQNGLPMDFTGGFGARVQFARTADTNAYAAGDVVGSNTGATAALTFAVIGPVGGGRVMIASASLEIDINAVPTGMGNFRLYLYNVTPPSALGDNAAWDLPTGDRASFLGFIDLGTPVDLGSTLYVEANTLNKIVATLPAVGGASLFGYLTTSAGYTPNSASVFTVNLHAVAL